MATPGRLGASARRVAVVGGGWAGLSAAVHAVQRGDAVTLLEASRHWGGRARSLSLSGPDGRELEVDNGQHILVGAYRDTLALMRTVGVDPAAVLLRLPLTLRFADGGGLQLPDWRPPLDAAWGILRARGWHWSDRLGLIRAVRRWQAQGFACHSTLTVGQLCAGLTPRVQQDLIEPLCVAALNTPAPRASAQVFLRVLEDSLFGRGDGGWAGSNLLLPRVPLGQLMPQAAVQWLRAHGATVRPGVRVGALIPAGAGAGQGWRLEDGHFDQVVLACPAPEAARLVRSSGVAAPTWLARAEALAHEPIATVYALGPHALPSPMLALRSGEGAPAQFVFDRGQLGGPPGLLAFVASACATDREAVETDVMAQARALGWTGLQVLQTVLEKRATFACTAGLQRPSASIAPGLSAAGDYVQGPYPATLEGAVRSGLASLLSPDRA